MIDRELLATLGGRVRELRGHHTLVLDDPRVMWFVEEGAAGVFASRVADGLPVGPRRLLFRAGAGSPLFAVTQRRRDAGIRLVVLSIDALRLLEVPLRRVDQVLAAAHVPFPEALEIWVKRLGGFLARDAEGSPGERLPEAGELVLDAGCDARAAPDTVAWVRIESGSVELLGMPELRVPALPVFLPLSEDLWLRTSTVVRLTVSRPAAIRDNAELLRGLSLLHALTQRRLALMAKVEQSADLARLEARDARQRGRLEGALHRVADVLNPHQTIPHRESALLGAVAVVGEALGFEARPPARSENLRQVRDPIEAIARASRVRMRRVTLAGEWWRNDSGPLVGSLAADRRPVALVVADGGGHYELVEPDSGRRRRVDRQLAEALEPRAVAFYRPLPEAIRKPWELVAFAMHGRLKDVALLAGLAVVVTLVGMLTPLALALVLDDAIPDANRRLLVELGLGLVAAAIGVTLFGLAQGVLAVRLAAGVDADVQHAVWDRLLRLKMAFFKRFSSGDLLARTTAVSEVARELNGQTLRSLLSSLMLLLNLALLYYYSARLAPIALLLGLAVATVTLLGGLLIRRHYRRLLELQGPFFGLVVQLVGAVAKLRVAGAENRAFALWAERYAEQLELMRRAQGVQDAVAVVNQAVPALGVVLLFWFGIEYLAGDGVAAGRERGGREQLSVGMFLAFNAALATFIAGATALSNTAVDVLDTLVSARRVTPLLAAEPEVHGALADPGVLSGELALVAVDFRYTPDGPKVLDGVNVRAAPGEFVAFVGPSGSGKSTIVRLLLGFEQPQSGVVTYDGQDLKGLDGTAVRRQLGVVMQSGRINAGSVFENISAGALISLDEAWQAAEDAGLADEIRATPMGLHTFVAEGGSNLSGGQRQRLFLARALARRPRILLLDEATSALDNRTQALVSGHLEHRKVTRLVVAHRLSTIRNADRIYVLDEGRVVASGGFVELMRTDGPFKSMMSRQMA